MTTNLSRKMAHLSRISYFATSRCNSKTYYEVIADNIKYKNIVFDRKNSTCDVLVFYNKRSRQLYIVHRGTDVMGKRCGADLLADVNIIFGNTKNCANFKRRSETTEKVIRYYKKRKMVSKIYGSGHSLGGTTLYKTLFTHPYVLKNFRRTYLFNEPYTAQNNKFLSPEITNRISQVVIHYRVKCDLISKILEFSKPLGKVITIEKDFLKRI